MSRQRMRPVDAAWLRMDRPTNLMIVTAVMWFHDPVDYDRLRDLLQERLISRYPRFTQRVADEGVIGGLWWETVAAFDIDDHIHRTELPEPGGRAELEAFASSKLSEPMRWNRPLWDAYLIEEYGSGSAVVFRIHHAIADGIALVRVLLSLTDGPAGEPAATPPREEPDPLLRRLARTVDPRRISELRSTIAADVAAAGKLLLLPPDAETALRGEVAVDKRVTWSEPVSLDLVKQIGRAHGATINDVLLAAVAGALRAELVRRRSPVHDVRAIVPFNLRPLDQPLPRDLGNAFGLVFLDLPMATAARPDRLAEMARRMQAIKDSPEGAIAYGILELVGAAPAAVEKMAIDIFTAKGTGVMTNVPGPRDEVRLAGARLAGTIGWGPTTGDLALGVAIFSYAGEVTIGLAGDVGVIPDIGRITSDILAELDAMAALT